LSMVLPFILMGQTLPFPGKDSATIRKTVLVSLGLASGKFDNSNALYQGEGCDRVGNRAYFNQKYVVSGAGLTFTTENPDLKTKTSWGMGFILGSHAESYLSTDTTWNAPKPAPELLPENERKLIWGIHPFLSYDSRWFGIGGGWHMGKLGYSWHWREVEDTGFPYTGRKEVSLFPSLYLRVGPRDVAYADYHLADQFPSAFPGYLHMIGVGTGLGSFNRYSIRLGTLIGGPDRSQGILDIWDIPLLGLYTTGYFPLKNGFALEPLLVFTSAGADGKTDTQFSLGLHYQWNRKK